MFYKISKNNKIRMSQFLMSYMTIINNRNTTRRNRPRNMKKWRGNKRPILNPFAITFLNVWSYTQPSWWKWFLQLFSINWPTKIKLANKSREKYIIKGKPQSSNRRDKKKALSLAIWICWPPLKSICIVGHMIWICRVNQPKGIK